MLARGFIKLLKRYQSGTLPHSVKEVIDIWYHAIMKEPVEYTEKEEVKERVWAKIRQDMFAVEKTDSVVKPLRNRVYKMVKVAALVLFLLGSVLYFSESWMLDKFAGLNNEVALNSEWVEEINQTNVTRCILLPDGSKVDLEPGARLRFPKNYEEDFRKVYLYGNAFFDVTKDSNRPFLVSSESVLIRVLGTSFNVKSISETGGTEVAVVTGKVVVEKAKYRDNSTKLKEGEGRVVLTPNKKVTFFNDSDHYITGLVEKPVLLANQQEYLKPDAFYFDETPLVEVLEKLEKAYGVEITLSNDNMLECPITADLTADYLYEKIEIIGAILNAEYEITGSAILLTGGGCEATNLKPKP